MMTARGAPDDGANVLVTGAQGGLGVALTAALGRRGDKVVGVDRPGTAADVEADLTDPEQVAAAVLAAADRLGGIDAIVGAAGVVDAVHRAATIRPEAFESDIAANLNTQFLVAQAAYPYLRESPTGVIVMVSSLAGLDGLSGQVSYAAAKAGVIGLARSLAAEWIGEGIRVNVVAPGLFATPKVAALPDTTRHRLLRGVPMGRVATLDEVVAPILFLLSSGAGYITGHVLRIDGGTGLGVHGLYR